MKARFVNFDRQQSLHTKTNKLKLKQTAPKQYVAKKSFKQDLNMDKLEISNEDFNAQIKKDVFKTIQEQKKAEQIPLLFIPPQNKHIRRPIIDNKNKIILIV